MSKKEYFAYGSNLNFDQMAYRCPEATVVGTAKLDGYELAFRRGYLTVPVSYTHLTLPTILRV